MNRRQASSIRLTAVAAALVATAADAQVRLDRADPTIIEQALPPLDARRTDRPDSREVETPLAAAAAGPVTGAIAGVTVTGAPGIDAAAYADSIASVIGREVGRTELARLADAIGKVVRERGYPFATVAIPPQAMADGILRVTVDPGRIDAVRVIGAKSAAADRLLVRALAGRGAVRQADLERALLLVGDLPGVRVKESRYLRQDGFGILLVTIEQDRVSAYAQLDNRGSKEVGPVRSTLLASLRGLAADGDELSLIAANTPIQPREFVFGRARYAAPIDAAGSVVSLSGSYGRSNPGASLAALDVVGRSTDATLGYARPLLRRRDRSLWVSAELRAVAIDQSLAGLKLRRDRLVTATGSVRGAAKVAGGVLRGDVSVVAGLPAPGVTHESDNRKSRADGDARFATLAYQLEWLDDVAPKVSVAVASAGQIASRPLLASAEIQVGGPAFGRGYDYAERTGDNGIMGSVELRFDAGRLIAGAIDRAQFYGFVDGGVVGNLDDGVGGGTLASAGLGVRAGIGRLDGMAEIAFPLNKDRFDTGDRRPRVSLRVSRAF